MADVALTAKAKDIKPENWINTYFERGSYEGIGKGSRYVRVPARGELVNGVWTNVAASSRIAKAKQAPLQTKNAVKALNKDGNALNPKPPKTGVFLYRWAKVEATGAEQTVAYLGDSLTTAPALTAAPPDATHIFIWLNPGKKPISKDSVAVVLPTTNGGG